MVRDGTNRDGIVHGADGVALCGDCDGQGASAADGVAHRADCDGIAHQQ